jgi:hypothetical protein
MKITFARFAGLVALGFLLVTFSQTKTLAQDVVVSYQTFYDELSPYGQWVDDPEYGSVWVPNEAPGYRPYATNGHWAMTEYGNMWVSDAPYGWATYHYGRWTYNSYYGWVWIPGHEWAPAWVSWRSGGGYYGWAPMGPGYVAGGVYDYPDNYWVFVGPQYLYQPNVYNYYEPRHVRRYIRQTSYINETYVDNNYHTTYYYGPRREIIERETHQPVQVYHVSNAGNPRQTSVTGGVVQIYRPAVNRETRQTARPANSIRGTQPVGRPQEFSPRQGNSEPQFRQDMQRQNPAQGQRNPQPQNNGQRDNRQNYQNENRGGNREPQQYQNRPQPQRFQEPSRQQPESRPQPQYNRPQPEQRSQPQPQPQQRPQPMPQPQPQQRPQPMPQQQQRSQPTPQPQGRPQPQQRQQPKPQGQRSEEEHRGR